MDNSAVYEGRLPTIGGHALLSSGKVRDSYELDRERILFVTSDRISAFDIPMGRGIPHKGRVLTAVAAHWFHETEHIIDHHLLSTDPRDIAGVSEDEISALEGRVMIVRSCQPTSVEWVVRGYIAGSGWKEYQRSGTVCGIQLPAGLQLCGRLPEPILTPTTKDDVHDEPLTTDQARQRVGDEIFKRAHEASLALFDHGTRRLGAIGILLADTKFEFGMHDGKLLLIDEALTQDSSRFWPRDLYEVGQNQPSFDKQILRDWLEATTWDKEAPAPPLPDDLVARISQRYLDIGERITGATPAGVSA